MKVRATIDWKIYKLIDKDVNRARVLGEEWEITKKRLKELEKFPYPLVEEIEKTVKKEKKQ